MTGCAIGFNVVVHCIVNHNLVPFL
jgi:hypothetical protein